MNPSKLCWILANGGFDYTKPVASVRVSRGQHLSFIHILVCSIGYEQRGNESMLVTCWTVGVKCLMSTVNREKYIKEGNRCLTDLASLFPYVRQQSTSQIYSYEVPTSNLLLLGKPLNWKVFMVVLLFFYLFGICCVTHRW